MKDDKVTIPDYLAGEKMLMFSFLFVLDNDPIHFSIQRTLIMKPKVVYYDNFYSSTYFIRLKWSDDTITIEGVGGHVSVKEVDIFV